MRPELALPMDCSIGKARQLAPSGLGLTRFACYRRMPASRRYLSAACYI